MATKIQDQLAVIFREIRAVFQELDQTQVDQLTDQILKAEKVVVCGAGRVGLAIRGFGMRLGHLGLPAWALGDATVPAIGAGDLLLAASGSGETQTIFDLVAIAKKNRAMIGLITGNPESRMGKLADSIVILKAPSKTKPVEGLRSVQPMTTLNEQCLGIFFDALVLSLMERMSESHDTMWVRHSNLE